MRIDLVPRLQTSRRAEFLAPLGAFMAALLIGALIVLALGKSPVQAFSVYFIQPLSEGWSLQELAVKASPLILIATGLAFCYRANVWNIGAEGQFIIGGAMGGWIALLTHNGAFQAIGSWWILPAMLAAGAIGGMIYALVPALLRTRLGVSEILTSLLMVYVAELFLDYMVRGPWRDLKGFNFPVSVNFDPAATLPLLTSGGRLHAGVLITILVVIAATVILGRTLFGFRIRTVGDAPRAARFAGFDDKATTLAVFAISGALAGLAGIIEVSGQIQQLQPSISPGYGFTAIIVAFLGRLSPPGIVLAGLMLALTYIGGESAQIAMKIPLDLTRAFQGVLLMCVLAADVFVRNRLVVSGRVPA